MIQIEVTACQWKVLGRAVRRKSGHVCCRRSRLGWKSGLTLALHTLLVTDALGQTIGGVPLSRGSDDAPVDVTIWSDVRSPLAREAYEALSHVDGQHARVTFKFLPSEDDSQDDRVARGLCAAKRQGKYEQMHAWIARRRLLKNDSQVTDRARELGLNPLRFERDFSGDTCAREIVRDRLDAARVSATAHSPPDSTLATINGTLLVDASGPDLVKSIKLARTANTSSPKRDLYWNVWAEESDVLTFKPAARLRANTTYLLALDLAALKYSDASSSARLPSDVRAMLEAWALDARDGQVPLNVVMIPDGAHFVSPAVTSQRVSIDADKVRAFANIGRAAEIEDPFGELRKHSEQDFRFGPGATFELRTAEKEGWGTVNFHIWTARWRPLHAFSVSLCVSRSDGDSPCERPVATSEADASVVIGGLDKLPAPAASILFFATGPNDVVRAVLQPGSGPNFAKAAVWSLRDSAASLSQQLRETILPEIGRATSDAELNRVGANLFDLFFPDDAGSKHGRHALLKLLNPGANSRPELVVSFKLGGPDPPLVVPFHTMRPGELTDFIGKYARIETPLERQTFQPLNGCLNKWHIMLPTRGAGQMGDTALDQAMTFLRGGDGMNNQLGAVMRWMDRTPAVFRDWTDVLKMLSPNPLPSEPAPSSVLAFLSHHERGQLRVSSTAFIQSHDIRTKFRQPSVAVLAGCGTAGPAASQIIRAMNVAGISTILATSAEISGYMGAQFLECFTDAIEKNGQDRTFTIGRAFDASVVCVKQAIEPGTKVPYGARANKLMLLGNPHVRVCAPR